MRDSLKLSLSLSLSFGLSWADAKHLGLRLELQFQMLETESGSKEESYTFRRQITFRPGKKHVTKRRIRKWRIPLSLWPHFWPLEALWPSSVHLPPHLVRRCPLICISLPTGDHLGPLWAHLGNQLAKIHCEGSLASSTRRAWQKGAPLA